MASNPIPADLNWVKVRAECSISNVFKTLELRAKEDVKTRSDVLLEHEKNRHVFRVEPSDRGNYFSVIHEVRDHTPMRWSESVDFSVEQDEIVVKDGSKETRAVLTIANDGRCKLKVAGDELEKWQFLRTALERLFFGPAQSATTPL